MTLIMGILFYEGGTDNQWPLMGVVGCGDTESRVFKDLKNSISRNTPCHC